jgi:hypothetical protein
VDAAGGNVVDQVLKPSMFLESRMDHDGRLIFELQCHIEQVGEHAPSLDQLTCQRPRRASRASVDHQVPGRS